MKASAKISAVSAGLSSIQTLMRLILKQAFRMSARKNTAETAAAREAIAIAPGS